MKIIEDYKILEDETKSELEYEVENLISQGFQLHGDLNVVPVLISDGNLSISSARYMQAMIRYRKRQWLKKI